MPTSVQIRDHLVDVLRLDLVGPEPGGEHADEILPTGPSRWYLTGFLVPYEAPEAQRSDGVGEDQIDLPGGGDGGDDESTPEQASGRRVYFPSSMGVSVLVPPEVKTIEVTVTWGDYTPIAADAVPEEPPPASTKAPALARTERWKRTPRRELVTITLGKSNGKAVPKDVPNGGGIQLVTSARAVPDSSLAVVPRGTRSVSLFLVNNRKVTPDVHKDQGFVFQPALRLQAPSFVARPNLRGRKDDDDWDERVGELQFRDAFEFAVGHGISTKATLGPDGACREVETVWIPSASVEKVEPGKVPTVVELGMEALAAIQTHAELTTRLSGLVSAYGTWIQDQRDPQVTVLDTAGRKAVAAELLRDAETARKRIADGIEALREPKAFLAFQLANRAMGRAARQRSPDLYGTRPPTWRPFQLAFILMNVRGIVDPTHADRRAVDLLFFPTGGGKTEAYLGLAAFTMVLRRLGNPGVASAGMSVLMRYTLRLLTLDQLGRAATLVCALELLRREDETKEPSQRLGLGPWPFEIGLWVGQAATPNRMGHKGDNDKHSARTKTIAFQNDTKKPAPIPIENCPWCNAKFDRSSFHLEPSPDQPTDLRIACAQRRCAFGGAGSLPIVTVDDVIYRRVPAFLIATVDKFAQLPWVGRCGALFGKVDRHDKAGFYGPCDLGRGDKLARALLPPDLIIQDELHLISGPLGTMVGLYETAIDALSESGEGEAKVAPKIIASTATVRRAEAQIHALFGRSSVHVFPPPGPNRRDSFFAQTVPLTEKNARSYIGIAAQGRSLKVVLLRTYLALLAATQRVYEAEGGARTDPNPTDAYMTLLGYFNSLRELGGSRRIVEDEVSSRLHEYEERRRIGRPTGSFANRALGEVEELTSRKSTNDVSNTKRRLGLPFNDKERVDLALATNMISVGLDITRLGLMVVLGQPKTTSEYIQATSRVGRDDQRPGLVVTLLNIHRPRDRSHYERFEAYHTSFYRDVEATSVTPFSPRAVDRGLPAITVALARLGFADLTPPLQAVTMASARTRVAKIAEIIAKRAESHAQLPVAERDALAQKLRGRVGDLLDSWAKVAMDKQSVGAGLQYQREVGSAPPLLFDPLDPELKKQGADARKFKAQRSLRDVEPSVNLIIRRLDGVEVPTSEGGAA